MTRCRKLLPKSDTDVDEVDPPEVDSRGSGSPCACAEPALLQCAHCGSDRMELIETTARPSWRELLWRGSETCPTWYSELQWADHRRLWTETHGTEFYDWYLETQLEGAKEIGGRQPSPIQLFLAGMTPGHPFHVQSY